MSKAGWIRTILLVGAVGALELACRIGAIAPTMVTAPSKMVTTLVETLRSDEIGMHLRCSVGVHRRWTPREDHGRRCLGDYFLGRNGVGHDLGVDASLTHPPSNQLGVLRAKVDDEYQVVL